MLSGYTKAARQHLTAVVDRAEANFLSALPAQVKPHAKKGSRARLKGVTQR